MNHIADTEHRNTGRRGNPEKKLKKNRERTDVHGCTGIEGTGVCCNALQRSFEPLQTALTGQYRARTGVGGTL